MRIINILVFACVLASCDNNKVVNEKEVSAFLNDSETLTRKKGLVEEIAFWSNKLESDKGNFVFASELTGFHLAYFHLTGSIRSLHAADSLMMLSAKALDFTDPKMLQARAQLSVTKHQFAEAYALNEQAKSRSASPFVYSLLRFDTDMELGRYGDADKNLKRIADRNSFHYLIRRAKQMDHEGDLEGAILKMETAFDQIRTSDNKSLFCWTLSNLADMYGHAGRINDAYEGYITVLHTDPSYLYALKGIAWIAYSHDKDPEQARRITKFIMKHNVSADYNLFLAELAEYEGNKELSHQLKNSFATQVSRPEYGDMYNKYLIELFSEDPTQLDRALQIAEKEVHNRPTPETFGWLAWVNYKKGNFDEAATIFQNHVQGHTSEPGPLLKGYYIMNKAGKSANAEVLRKKSLEAAFELGPVAVQKLKSHRIN